LLSFQNGAAKDYFIVGLGNPGFAYEKTRHNIGFRVVVDFAKRHRVVFRKNGRLSAEIGRGTVLGKDVALMLPLTYMNRSGLAIKKAGASPNKMIVVVDDVALPFGTLRLREEGSSGGHNGLKSIEESLGTKAFARLRLGVGKPEGLSLSDYVLSPFEETEEAALPEIFEKSAALLSGWLLRSDHEKRTKTSL
jgi:PTH1 family peptidyl-tRNA hydrolase